ncbi:porin family protein [Seonamhaeicola marinus]|uniref:PorT family protein n=1 Tax=Seonamhaeicola marinus TaxID=1912246 RepID=A0A5D0HT55_9FLAO|nr:porin family protein [Seonamhaeicola marinus]TYA74506.1 PorT family protein [Seonamhaeicola marinus]
MERLLLFCYVLLSTYCCVAQDQVSKEIDSLYKEDQIYAGVTYNLLAKKPENVEQNGFSLGFHFGFIKDMPINRNRNIALGMGLGYSANSYNQNVLISRTNEIVNYSIDASSSFRKNKFSTHLIEMPLEFRWRTSTPTEYSFWRIYTGIKFGYVFAHRIKYRGDLGDYKLNNVDDFNKLQYGITLSFGYNTWNLHVYYGLNPVFDGATALNGEAIDFNTVKIGLMFYLL